MPFTGIVWRWICHRLFYYARFKESESVKTVTQTYIRQIKDGDSWKEFTDNTIGTLDSYTHSGIVGETASSTATAKEGYEFVGWYDEARTLVSEDKLSNNGKTLSYTTTGDATYYARFKQSETVKEPTEEPKEKPTEKPTEGSTEGPTEKPTEETTEKTTEETTEKKAENETQTESGKGKQAKTKKDAPETGDESNPVLWTVLLLVSMAALAGLLTKRKNYK